MESLSEKRLTRFQRKQLSEEGIVEIKRLTHSKLGFD